MNERRSFPKSYCFFIRRRVYPKKGTGQNRLFARIRKKLVMLHFKIGNVADPSIIEYFDRLGKIA